MKKLYLYHNPGIKARTDNKRSFRKVILLITVLAFLGFASSVSSQIRSGFNNSSLSANDDGSTGLVPLGFAINFFGNQFQDGYINNNGNMTFDSQLGTFTPFNLNTTNRIIMAPFFADVDTRGTNSSLVRYGQGFVGGRPAFGVNWPGVGCFSSITHVLNNFQMVIINRSDIGPGDFDLEYNYDQIEWEAGTASGGDGDCQGGSPARIGYSNGEISFELQGSGIIGAFLDSNQATGLIHNSRDSVTPGRYVFAIRNGEPPTGHRISGILFGNNSSNPLAEGLIQVCTDNFGSQCVVTRTNAIGFYNIGGLEDGSYEITGFPPANTNFQPGSIGPVQLNGSDLDNQNIILIGPSPIEPGVSVFPNLGISPGGVPSVYWRNDLTLTTLACTGGSATYSITNQNGAVVRSGTMSENPTGTYSATVSQFFPDTGRVTVQINVDCPNPAEDRTIVFTMYIDPSGVVQTTSGDPIANATVTLLRADTSAGPFLPVPDGDAVMSPENRSNPDTTNNQGMYGWDVIAGFYVVRAEALNCVSPADASQSFVDSAVLTIPPPVTDLVLELECESPILPHVCDLDEDGNIDIDDLFQLYGTLGNTVTPGLLGDINSNGIIGIDDARGCALQCTLPNCAT